MYRYGTKQRKMSFFCKNTKIIPLFRYFPFVFVLYFKIFLLLFFFIYDKIFCGEFETILTEGFTPEKTKLRR